MNRLSNQTSFHNGLDERHVNKLTREAQKRKKQEAERVTSRMQNSVFAMGKCEILKKTYFSGITDPEQLTKIT